MSISILLHYCNILFRHILIIKVFIYLFLVVTITRKGNDDNNDKENLGTKQGNLNIIFNC